MIKRIFLDLDDVLNRCTMYALKCSGCDVDVNGYDGYKPEWGWSMMNAVNALHKTRRFTEDTFWKGFTREFWATIPKSAECDHIIWICSNLVGNDNLFILTRPILHADCYAGKFEWVEKNLPDFMHDKLVPCAYKDICSKSETLLIDDSPKNVQGFIAAGGDAIMMPRPFNDLHDIEDSRGHVLSQLQSRFTDVDCFKRTGRTERMFEQVRKNAGGNDITFVVGLTPSHAKTLEGKYKSMFGDTFGVDFISATYDRLDLGRLRVRGCRGRVFVDHYVWEAKK